MNPDVTVRFVKKMRFLRKVRFYATVVEEAKSKREVSGSGPIPKVLCVDNVCNKYAKCNAIYIRSTLNSTQNL